MVSERDRFGFDAPAPLDHPARRGLPAGHPTGPGIGERLPNFVLPDHSGRLVDFNEDRGANPAVVVFYRSVVW